MNKKDIVIAIISVVVIFGLFLFSNPSTFIDNLKGFNPLYLILIILLLLTDLTLRVVRWWFLLRSQEHHLPFKALIYPSFSSSFLNLVLPGRAGELVRLYALRDEYDVRYSVGLSVIIVEQVINMMGLIIVSSFALGLILFTGIELNNSILNELVPYAFIGSLAMIVGVFLLFVIDPNHFIPLFFFYQKKLNQKLFV